MKQRRPLTTIGSKEMIDLPEQDVLGVPAKIDTGADYSSIWASDVRMQDDGSLRFKLFSPHSRFFSGRTVTTTHFRSTAIKNSFGTGEQRYMVQLLIRVRGRTIRAWFTLADRSEMRYPVLLGRRLLHGKFLVDVTRVARPSQAGDGVPAVAVIGPTSAGAKAFYTQLGPLAKTRARIVCISYQDLLFDINGQKTSVRNIADQNRDLASYQLVYFKTHAKQPEAAAALAQYLQYRGVYFVDRDVLMHASVGKLSEYMQLACHGLPVPESVSAPLAHLHRMFDPFAAQLGLPFVLKEAGSNRGRNNFLVHDVHAFDTIVAAAAPDDVYIAQKHIPNDGFWRLFVLGNTVAIAIWRATYPHDEPQKAHLNKPSGGPNATLVPSAKVPSRVHDLALRSAACMKRQVAGVDLVQDKRTKKWYILEVNNAPQMRSGAFVQEKAAALAQYFDQQLREHV